MPRSARVVIQPADDDGLQETQPETPAAAASLRRLLSLDDPAIGHEALAAAEASRRAYDERQDDASVGERRRSFFVHENSDHALDDWLAKPHVKRKLWCTERALSEVENGTGSIEEVNMFYAIMTVDLDLMDRFTKAGGRCDFWKLRDDAAHPYATASRTARTARRRRRRAHGVCRIALIVLRLLCMPARCRASR